MEAKQHKTAPIVKRYRTIAGITIGAVVFLILVGAVVRMTGSGMGCPDWPKCFGQWVPPTDISQLPPDYKEQFKVAGKEIADFDAFKTWVEYINRLIGVLIGFFVLLTAAASWKLRESFPRVFQLSILSLVLVIVQGLIGAVVVRTNLHVGMISVHLVMAWVILGVLLGAFMASYQEQFKTWQRERPAISSKLLPLVIALLVVTLVQLILGTQVREQIDQIALEQGENRGGWIAGLGLAYSVHKYFYYLVFFGILHVGLRLRSLFITWPIIKYLAFSMLGIVIVEIGLGLGMHHFAIPAVFQPMHLLFATLLLGVELLIVMTVYMGKEANVKENGPVATT